MANRFCWLPRSVPVFQRLNGKPVPNNNSAVSSVFNEFLLFGCTICPAFAGLRAVPAGRFWRAGGLFAKPGWNVPYPFPLPEKETHLFRRVQRHSGPGLCNSVRCHRLIRRLRLRRAVCRLRYPKYQECFKIRWLSVMSNGERFV